MLDVDEQHPMDENTYLPALLYNFPVLSSSLHAPAFDKRLSGDQGVNEQYQ